MSRDCRECTIIFPSGISEVQYEEVCDGCPYAIDEKSLEKEMAEFTIKENDDPFVYAECEDCGWKGKPEECVTEVEENGFTGPYSEVSCCPRCGWSSVFWLRESDIKERE